MDSKPYLVHYRICTVNYLYRKTEIVELRHLRYFVAVAEELSFTRAAMRLHISIPPLSVQVRNLEAEIGAQLLSRDGRGLKLTQAGKVFIDHARKLLADAARGAAFARQAADGEVGNLAIGYNAPAEFRVFPKIVPAFQKKWPDVHLRFHSLNVSQQLEKLHRDELDVGFVWLPVPTDEFDVQKLVTESLVVVLPAKHALASAATVSVKDLSKQPLISFPRALFPDMYFQVEQLFLRTGTVMNVAHELESPLSVVNFVAMGIGCSLLPGYVRHIRHDGVVFRPLRRPNMVKSLAMIKKKGRGDLAAAFYRFTADNFAIRESERASATARGGRAAR